MDEIFFRYVPALSSVIVAIAILFGGLVWVLRLVLRAELLPIEQRLSRVEALLEGQAKS